ncbi:poly(ADP-ribose) polymerase family member 14-related sequence 1 isoform X2 [Anabas testudineus]|uniref:poly(ADP-ribose) polymerase family member 14-related sequence 1 isoform X2 n=1 Tax=Anabas testudineus TaxID=64144 RepID=UPI000E4574F5|nr:poly(ADP-ribose) polymerase family member 14-related sequence 1 isoform X2 [Anabas testudineus]
MADAYSFPVLVELEENDTPRLKNKLVKYFQSKKSGGGDCEVDYEHGSRTATLRFRTEEDQKNVCRRETHQISLDKGVLKMTVRLPADETTAQETSPEKFDKKSEPIIVKTIMAPPAEKKRRVHAPQKFLESNQERWSCLHISSNTDIDINLQGPAANVPVNNKQSSADEVTPAAEVQGDAKHGDDDTPDEELCSTMAVVGNINETLSQEFLEMLVENILRGLKASDSESLSQSYTLEIIPHISSAVVTFQSGKENTNFMTRCPENKTFKKNKLSVCSLEVTKKVLAEDIQNLSEDIIRLYFENEGGDVEDIVLNQVEQSAIITFKEHQAVRNILKKNKHRIRQEEISVYPFYESLGIALYGKDKPPLKLPATISESIDDAMGRYLNRNQSASATIHRDLAKHFCKADFTNQSTVYLSPVSSLLHQKDAKVMIKEWRDTVKSAFAQAMSKFRSLKFHPDSEAWQESEEKLRQMLEKEDVDLISEKASGDLFVVGLVEQVNRLEKPLSEVLNKIAKRVRREKSSITQEIKMSPSTFHILCQDGLQDKLLQVYPELKISFKKDCQDLTVTGLNDEIFAASKVMYDAMFALKRQNLDIDQYVFDLLKDEEQEELTNTLLISNGINAAFEISTHRVQLLAVSERDLSSAEGHLGRLLISHFIDVEDSNVLQKPEWKHLVSQLEKANSKSCRKIRINTTGQQAVVSGHRESVMKVSEELDDFLKQNAHVEEAVVVNHNAIVEYFKLDTSRLKTFQDRVVMSYRKDSISLSGSRADVSNCKTLVEELVSSVFFESLKVAKAGAKKFFKDKESMYVNSLLSETHCLVQLVDEISVGQDDLAHRQVPKPVYQLQTPDGVEIAVCKADMCHYPVYAVVNSSNQDLNLNGGLGGALLKAAGPQLQDECDKVINVRGPLKPGDCVLTNAGGQLWCKKVIHAIGPKFDPAKPPKALALLRKAVKESLELAEMHNIISVALPVISRGQGFPLNLCAITIVKAAKEYCDEKFDDNTLKKIHFVNNDDGAVQAMEAAVRQEFGNHGVSHSQQTPQTKAIKAPLGSDPNCLGQVKTKEGLEIILVKGNIENATTEVTVNTVFEDLALNRGAVSNAILQEAGPTLQQLVKAKNASGIVGEIIVTDGCKLKSKQVFHAVSPHWDKGQGTADKILRGIFKDCMEKAENTGLTSISFPAIGTGNLRFPKDLVVNLMLDEILAFSSKKQPKHLKKVMIILYSGDAQTIQVFSKEFKKKFPNATVIPVSASSPQSQGPFSKVTSSSTMHETKMGSVAIQVVTGDITKETTDVIVNSSNESFSLKSGVSKAILDAAGQAVETECQNLAAQSNPAMIMTQPGNLKCKKILHLVGQTDPVKIKNTVKDALQMCVKNTYTSVSFPAIGTGQGSVQPGQVADAMLDAVIDVLNSNPSVPLKTIRIVIFQPPMLKDFYNSMEERAKIEASDTKEKGGFWGNIGSKIKSLFVGTADKPQKEGDFVIEALKVDPACFHICGNSQTDVDSAKKWINDLISKELYSSNIQDNAIHSFSDADYKHLENIQKTLGVSIRTESKKGQASVTIEGLSKDVLEGSNVIHEMLRKARDKQVLEKNIELAGTVADWQYQQQGFQFQSFDAMTNYNLEQALENNQKTVKVTIKGQDYTVTMPSGPATDSQGRTLNIKRIDKLKDDDIPEHWDAMPANTTCQAITIKAGTGEYDEVQNLFKASCNRTITKIERIQNPGLWKSLQVKRRDMEQRNGHGNNVRRLFHGTCHTTVDWINEHGFNRSYAGRNATYYGNGTYFAVNASYSAHDTYSKPNTNGEKFMYLCQVLTGDFSLGQQGMIVPPEKSTGSVQKYDSVVDNMSKPSMFVIFHDSQACPEYLITFK